MLFKLSMAVEMKKTQDAIHTYDPVLPYPVDFNLDSYMHT